MTRISTAAIMQ